ncbi:hypothetical protein [Paludisphaera soli]|uniref:hypothetical protein n=1 Tax=Paludisphaera soli TaxID=2712865 RepID=UPI0013EBA048|nr:hypothetical protein [Paludisphaera soli]
MRMSYLASTCSLVMSLTIASLTGAMAAEVYTVVGVQGLSGVQGADEVDRYGDYWNESAAAGSAAGSAASASISLLADPGVRLSVSGRTDLALSTAQAAVAQWRDVIRLNDGHPIPDSIYVTLEVTGIY